MSPYRRAYSADPSQGFSSVTLTLMPPRGSDVKYLSLPHSCAVRGVRVVAEGDDLPRVELESFSLLHPQLTRTGMGTGQVSLVAMFIAAPS